MGGDIGLVSSAGEGTMAHFTIPFKKPQRGEYSLYTESLPERLQSDMSVSCQSSSNADAETRTPPESFCGTCTPEHESNSPLLQSLSQSLRVDRSVLAIPEGRQKCHVLVVEDSKLHPHSVDK
jgi:hypothetical protein